MFRNLLFFLSLAAGLFLATGVQAKDQIIVAKISGPINPVVAEFVTHEIEEANSAGELLVILEMDTPGGLDTSMRQIIKAIQSSSIPVATFVSPSGSRAASAGTFITIASHIAAMAPGTNIGAAHPVNMMGGGGDKKDKEASTMEEKVVNDASAYIRSLAEQRGRNAYWAETAVRQSKSISAQEAKKLGVIDLIANNVEALILAIQGREIKTSKNTTVKLDLEGKHLVRHEMSKREKILDTISNPNVVYIFMMLGMVGLYFELSNPGLILPGVIGGISIILALYGMQTLPVNYAGLMLILLGGILFIAELNTASFGLLSAGGTISLLLGSLMLIDSDDPAMQISNSVLIPTLLVSVAVTLGTVYMAIKSSKIKSISGVEGLKGAIGVAKSEIDPEGRVMVHGEVWNAVGNEIIHPGEKVVVEEVEGLKIKVKKSV